MSRQTRLVHAVAGILKRNEQMLVALRPFGKPYSDYWEFPGGKVEPNESGEEALKRELFEELGIEVISAQNLINHHHEYPDKTVFLEVWLVLDFKGEPQCLEHQELRWVDLVAMRKLNILEGNWPILDKLAGIL